MPGQHATRPGDPSPLGATITNGGVNFSLFSQRATSVELLLFEDFDDPAPYQILTFHPYHNKTFFYWHMFVEGVKEGQIYAYRVDGPFDPFEGQRFNRNKILLDPYSKGVVYGNNWSREDARHQYPNTQSAMKSLVVDTNRYDWEGVSSPSVPMTETIIY